MAHQNIIFPECISNRSTASYTYEAETFRAYSGRSVVTAAWDDHLRSWDVATAIHDQTEFERFLNFWHAVGGTADTFLFIDRFDRSSAAPGQDVDDEDQNLGTAAASQTDFQLRKGRTYDSVTNYYDIQRPNESTVVVAVDGAPQTITTDYTIETGGIIRFVTPMTGGEVVTAGYQYYLKARFGAVSFNVVSPGQAGANEFYLQGTIPILQDRE